MIWFKKFTNKSYTDKEEYRKEVLRKLIREELKNCPYTDCKSCMLKSKLKTIMINDKVRFIIDSLIQLRRDTSNNWTKYNPILMDGEPGIESCKDGYIRLKIGDGVTDWNHLQYFGKDPVSKNNSNRFRYKKIKRTNRVYRKRRII